MARKLLQGNYEPEKNPDAKTVESLHEFEDEALDSLGGSIAFVRKGKLYEENNWWWITWYYN